ATAPAARLFEIVLGLLANGPEWLRPQERARYSVLFREFARFPVSTRGHVDYAETLPVDDLPRAASQWLRSLSCGDDPLLLSFGLDAVEFFFALVMGMHGYGERPELERSSEARASRPSWASTSATRRASNSRTRTAWATGASARSRGRTCRSSTSIEAP